MNEDNYSDISIWKLSVKLALLFTVIALLCGLHDAVVGTPRIIPWLFPNYLILSAFMLLSQAVYVRMRRQQRVLKTE